MESQIAGVCTSIEKSVPESSDGEWWPTVNALKSRFEGYFYVVDEDVHWQDGAGEVSKRWSGYCRTIEAHDDGATSSIFLTAIAGDAYQLELFHPDFRREESGIMRWTVSDWVEDEEFEYGTTRTLSARPLGAPIDSQLLFDADIVADRELLEKILDLREAHGSYYGETAPLIKDVTLRTVIAPETAGHESRCIGLAVYWKIPETEHEIFLARRAYKQWAPELYGRRWIDTCEEENLSGPMELPGLSKIAINQQYAGEFLRLFDSDIPIPSPVVTLFTKPPQDLVQRADLVEPIPSLLQAASSIPESSLGWHAGSWDNNWVSVAKALHSSAKVFACVSDMVKATDVALRRFPDNRQIFSRSALTSANPATREEIDNRWDDLERALVERFMERSGQETVDVLLQCSTSSRDWVDGDPGPWNLSFVFSTADKEGRLNLDIFPTNGGCDGSCRRAKWHYTFCVPAEEEIESFIKDSLDQQQLDAAGWDGSELTLTEEQTQPEIVARIIIGVARRAMNWGPELSLVSHP